MSAKYSTCGKSKKKKNTGWNSTFFVQDQAHIWQFNSAVNINL